MPILCENKNGEKMNNCNEQALSALKELIESNSMCLSEEDLIILKKKPDEIKQNQKRVGEIYESIFCGFFHCAAKGVVLYPEKRVAEKFGNSIEHLISCCLRGKCKIKSLVFRSIMRI